MPLAIYQITRRHNPKKLNMKEKRREGKNKRLKEEKGMKGEKEIKK
jgi:hypothetical protein